MRKQWLYYIQHKPLLIGGGIALLQSFTDALENMHGHLPATLPFDIERDVGRGSVSLFFGPPGTLRRSHLIARLIG